MGTSEQVVAEIWGVTGAAYDEISRGSSDAIQHCIDRLRPARGERILDVATATGWAARRLADRGARITGIDFSPAIIEAARKLSENGARKLEFQVADAEKLPFGEGEFDAVISAFGVIYAARPRTAAAEIARVCRSGGRLALTVWASNSVPAQVFELLQGYMRLAGAPPLRSPFEWGGIERISELLEKDFELGFELGTSHLHLPDGEAVWALHVDSYGPIKWLAEHLDPETLSELEERFIEFHNQFRTGLGVRIPREYLVVLGTRR